MKTKDSRTAFQSETGRIHLRNSVTGKFDGVYSFEQFRSYADECGENFTELVNGYIKILFEFFNVTEVLNLSEIEISKLVSLS
jgi:hypothetical protein